MAAYRYADTPQPTMMDNWNATMLDVGDAFTAVRDSVTEFLEAVASAPTLAASGMNNGVKGLPLPGHEAHTVPGGGPAYSGGQNSPRGPARPAPRTRSTDGTIPTAVSLYLLRIA